MFDEEPDGDPHGECAAEIKRLQRLLGEARAILKELVSLKDQKDQELRLRQRRPVRDPAKLAEANALRADYKSRKALAWERARSEASLA